MAEMPNWKAARSVRLASLSFKKAFRRFFSCGFPCSQNFYPSTFFVIQSDGVLRRFSDCKKNAYFEGRGFILASSIHSRRGLPRTNCAQPRYRGVAEKILPHFNGAAV